VGEDEFVELDEAGNPRKKAAKGGRPRPAANVRKKAPARRRPGAPGAVPDVPGVEVEESAIADDLDGEDPALVAAAVGLPPVAVPAPDRRPPARPPGGARRGGGRGPGAGRPGGRE
jgi:hypothetical protein